MANYIAEILFSVAERLRINFWKALVLLSLALILTFGAGLWVGHELGYWGAQF